MRPIVIENRYHLKIKVLNKSFFDYHHPLVSQYPLYRMRADTLDSLSLILTLTVSVSFLAMSLGCWYSRVAPREGEPWKATHRQKNQASSWIFYKTSFCFCSCSFSCSQNYRRQYDIKYSLTNNFVGCLLKIGTINSVHSERRVGSLECDTWRKIGGNHTYMNAGKKIFLPTDWPYYFSQGRVTANKQFLKSNLTEF